MKEKTLAANLDPQILLITRQAMQATCLIGFWTAFGVLNQNKRPRQHEQTTTSFPSNDKWSARRRTPLTTSRQRLSQPRSSKDTFCFDFVLNLVHRVGVHELDRFMRREGCFKINRQTRSWQRRSAIVFPKCYYVVNLTDDTILSDW